MSASRVPPPGAETLESRRLAEVLARLRGDGLLQGLLDLLAGGAIAANFPLGMVIDGVVFRGNLTTSESFAEHLDSTIAGWLAAADLSVTGSTDADTSAAKERIGAALDGGFTNQARSRQQYEAAVGTRLAQLWGQAQGEGYQNRRRIEDLPDELVADVVDYLAPRATLTLENAEMLLPSGGWAPVGLFRVVVSHIGGWWVDDGRSG